MTITVRGLETLGLCFGNFVKYILLYLSSKRSNLIQKPKIEFINFNLVDSFSHNLHILSIIIAFGSLIPFVWVFGLIFFISEYCWRKWLIMKLYIPANIENNGVGCSKELLRASSYVLLFFIIIYSFIILLFFSKFIIFSKYGIFVIIPILFVGFFFFYFY
jgi:hypothetical protein